MSDRAADIFLKQEKLTVLLRETGRDGLLLLDPANVAWFTGGATAAGIVDLTQTPGLYLQNGHRWLLSANVDSQRFFDEELDGLGFQLKEWPWHWGRAQLLADLCHGKKPASDVPYGDCLYLGGRLQFLRWTLSPLEQRRLMELGKLVAHALEATGRNLDRGDSEEEVAGQLGHRLIHHGVEPVLVQVSADGRNRQYRRHGPSPAAITRCCVLQATGRRWGLHVTASRSVFFGTPDDSARQEHDVACRVSAVQITSSTVRTKSAEILKTSGRILQMSGQEHEWRLAPVGWRTGFAPVEMLLVPGEGPDTLDAGQAVVWHAGIGGALSADTVVTAPDGPVLVTPADQWPVRRLKVGGAAIDRPDLLVRTG